MSPLLLHRLRTFWSAPVESSVRQPEDNSSRACEALERRVLLAGLDAAPTGREFGVNTTTIGDQEQSAVAVNDAGVSVVVWASEHQDGSGYGIYGQRYSADGVELGTEFLVNTTTAGNQSSPAIAINASGEFVVVWQSDTQSANGFDIYGQKFGATGQKLGSEFLVNTTRAGNQTEADVGLSDGGVFVVVWTSSGAQDGEGDGIFGQRFNGAGNKVGSEFLVNTSTNGHQRSAAISVGKSDWSFGVAWQGQSIESSEGDFDIFYQEFAVNGSKVGDETLVNPDARAVAAGDQTRPDLTRGDDGWVMVVWESLAAIGMDSRVYGRWISTDGTEDQFAFWVNFSVDATTHAFNPTVARSLSRDVVVGYTEYDTTTRTTSAQVQQYAYTDPVSSTAPHVESIGSSLRLATADWYTGSDVAVAMNASGDFTATWTSDGRDGSGEGVSAFRKVGPFLTPDEFRVNTTLAGDQDDASVAAIGETGYIVVWESEGAEGLDLYGQFYSPNGTRAGTEFLINTTTAFDQRNPSVVATDDGAFVVTWESVNQDGSPSSIYARFYQVFGSSVTAVSDEVAVNTTTAGFQRNPSVASFESGFVITWDSDQGPDEDDIYARTFSPTGTPTSGEFLVNTTTVRDQYTPSVAGTDQGGFVIVWASRDVSFDVELYGQRFSAAGTAVGAEFQFGQSTVFPPETVPVVAMGADGGFIVAWASEAKLPARHVVRAQRYAANGSPLGNVFQVNVNESGVNFFPTVDIDIANDGRFSISWAGRNDAGLYVRHFAADGSPFGTETLVSGDSRLYSNDGTIAVTSNSLFAVWTSNATGVPDVYARLIDRSPESGAELRVNDEITGNQKDPAVGSNSRGETVAVWHSGTEIYARRFDSDGRRIGGEVLIGSANSTSSSVNPTVAVAEDGGFAVAYAHETGSPSEFDLRIHRYDRFGREFGGVNIQTAGDQTEPSLDFAADGSFVAVWTEETLVSGGTTVVGRRFAANGNLVGGVFLINTTTANDQQSPNVAVAPDGRFVVTWSSFGQDGEEWGVYARTFAADGTPTSGEIAVNQFTTQEQWFSDVVIAADGSFVITWTSRTQDGNNYGIFARRFAANGTPLGDEFQVNQHIANSQFAPQITLDAGGNFAIVWESDQQDGNGESTWARRFAADGTPRGDEFAVNSFTTGNQHHPDIASDAEGNLFIIWESNGQDGSGLGVYAARFPAAPQSGPADVILSDGLDVLVGRSDGNSFREFNYGTAFDSNYQAVMYGDFDGNGHDDAVGLDDDGTWDLLLNTGEGFQAANDWAAWSASETWLQIVHGDFNGDGLEDVAARQSNGQWRVGISDGTQFTDSIWGGLTVSNGRSWTDIQIADFNGDGMDDIAGRLFDPNNASASGAWWVLTSQGANFTIARWGRWSTGATWEGIRSGDFDGDGDDDLVGRTAAGTLWVNISDGTQFTTSAWGALDGSQTWQNIRIGDFNGDGRDDVLSQTTQGWWHVATSTGAAFNVSRWSRWSTSATWTAIVVGDFNGDGRDDLGGLTSTNNWWVGVSSVDRFRTSFWGSWGSHLTPANVGVGNFA